MGSTPDWAPGTPVIISDHLNLTATTPLVGANFVDMTRPTRADSAISHAVSIPTRRGVYAQFPGPQYETPAEVRMAGILGADLVGMSTVLEAIAARAAGLEIPGLSLVTNAAAGLTGEALHHAEVLQAGDAATRLSDLLSRILERVTDLPPPPGPGSKRTPTRRPARSCRPGWTTTIANASPRRSPDL